ncbi:MAG: helix-turn-helix transcriptional regulator [Clostridia bacterium]|nr:helix-turn-helix transcriptional regulator [Clostridia bacterium]
MKKVSSIKIGKNIQKIRKSFGYTQERLAEEIDCSTRYISDIEQNRSNPSYEVLINICNLFNIGMDEIFAEYLDIKINDSVNYEITGFQSLKSEDKRTIEHLISFFNS